MELERFDPAGASRDEWRLHHEFRRRRHQEEHPDDPLAPDDAAEASLAWPDPFSRRLALQAIEAGSVAGWLSLSAPSPESPEYSTNKHIVCVDGWVLEPLRRRGIGRALLGPLGGFMGEHGITVASLSTETPPGHAFLKWLGAQPRFSSRRSRLDLAALDWDMVEAWARAGPAAASQSRMETFEPRLPRELLTEYLLAYNEMVNTVPFEELDHGDIVYTTDVVLRDYALFDRLGAVHHVAFTRESDGRISGVTEMIRYPYEPDRVHQELTAVQPWARGRGLGKWLKAAMLLRMRDAYPDLRLVITENAGSNAPMLGINQRLGFRPHCEEHTYQVGLEPIMRRAAEAR